MTKTPNNSTGVRRWSRQWWLGAGATFFWVAVVTILVWVYADMEFTKTAKVSVTIILNVGRSENLVLLSKPQTKVAFEVRGNRRELDVFLGKHNNTVVGYDVSELGPGRNQRLRVSEILNDKLNLEKLGLQIRSVNPANISGIHIDQRRPHKVPVEFDFTGAELVKVPQRDINVWATDTQWEKIEAELARKQARAVLRTVKTDLKNKEKGKPIKVTVDLTANIGGIPVRPEQSSLTVTIEIRKFTDTKTIQVTVRVLTPYTWMEDGTWDKYKFTRETQQTTWVKEVEVTGAKEDLDRLQPEQVDAYIVLGEDDKKFVASWLTRAVKFRFPPELKVELTGEAHIVKFKLEPRKAGVAAPPTAP